MSLAKAESLSIGKFMLFTQFFRFENKILHVFEPTPSPEANPPSPKKFSLHPVEFEPQICHLTKDTVFQRYGKKVENSTKAQIDTA